MIETTESPLAGSNQLIAPPIVDFLYYDEARHAHIVTFVPEDAVSAAEVEVVKIADGGADGLRIETQLVKLAHLFQAGSPVSRLTHSGAADFEVEFKDGVVEKLSLDGIYTNNDALTIYWILRDIAMTAQIAFIMEQRSKNTAVA